MKELKAFINKDNLHKVSASIIKSKIERPKYEDLLEFGNVFLRRNGSCVLCVGETYPRFVVDYGVKNIESIGILINKYNDWVYCNIPQYERTFPKDNSDSDLDIIAVYNSSISLKDIDTEKKFRNIMSEIQKIIGA